MEIIGSDILNKGGAICNECGEVMELHGDTFICPSCGWEVDEWEYEYEGFENDDEDEIPVGCAACGGPYPQCTTSCKLFDD